MARTGIITDPGREFDVGFKLSLCGYGRRDLGYGRCISKIFPARNLVAI